nr:MAG TPA: hypothetical protein [Crassvirales sp.]
MIDKPNKTQYSSYIVNMVNVRRSLSLHPNFWFL